MQRKPISRRQALGVIGKTGTVLGAGPYFFVSLNTTPLDGLGLDPQTAVPAQPQLARTPAVAPVQEKVVLSGSGSTLTVRVQGPPGRHVAVACAATDELGRYTPVTNARGLIGENGSAELDVRVADLPSGRVFVRILTAAGADFIKDRKGTKAFDLDIADGVVTRFGGVRERPLESASGAASMVAASSLATTRR